MDIEYLLVLQELREAAGPLAEAFFLMVSSVFVGAAMIAVPMVVYWCLDKRRGLSLLFGFGIATSLNNLVKSIACVPRPWVRDPRIVPSEAALEHATGFSFPSGHSQQAMSVYGGAGWAYRDRSKAAPILGGIITALVMFSRNYLGVHTPQDVIVAVFEAALIIWAMERIFPWLDEADDGRALAVLLASLVFTAAYIAFCTFKSYPDTDPASTESMILDAYEGAGFLLGCVAGWWLERRYVGFSVEGTRKEKALRLIVGIVIVVAVRYGVAAPLGGLIGETWRDFLKAFLPAICGLAGIPALFPAIKRFAQGKQG